MYDSKAPWARHMQKHIGEPGIEIPECKKIEYKKWQGHKSIEIQFALGPIDEENNNVQNFMYQEQNQGSKWTYQQTIQAKLPINW